MLYSIRLVLKTFAIFLCTLTLHAQISVQLSNVDPFGNKIDASFYPMCRVNLRATNGVTPITINTNNIYFRQNGQRALPFRVVPNGNQYEVYFNSRTTGSSTVDVIVTDKGLAGFAREKFDSLQLCLVRFLNSRGEVTTEEKINFAYVGDTATIFLQVNAYVGKSNPDGTQKPIRLDSLHMSSPDFKITWIGSNITVKPPPLDILPGFNYYFKVQYVPKSTQYIREYLTAHYEAGGQIILPITLFNQPLPERKELILLSPNGGEKFSPCEKFTIKWKGYSPDAPTIIDMQADNGEWKKIGESPDSIFVWTVPPTISDNVRIRVRQEYTAVQETALIDQKEAAGEKVNFSRDGATMLSAYNNGTVTEWDINKKQKLNSYSIGFQGFPLQQLTVLGVGYTLNNRLFYAYRDPGNVQRIAFFEKGNPNPLSTSNLSTVAIREVYPAPTGDYLVTVPVLGASISILNEQNATLVRSVVFEAPITGFSITKEKAVAAFLSGKIINFSLPDFKRLDSVTVPELTIAHNVSITNDGTLVSAATFAGEQTLYSNSNCDLILIDMNTKRVVRYSQNASGSNSLGLAFSPSNRFLAIGYQEQPQVSVWQLPGESSFLGNISGHSSTMTDIRFSPDGKTIATTSNAADNLKIRRLTFPESDTTDNVFSIKRPATQSQKITLKEQYISQIRDSVIVGGLCNTGDVTLVVETTRFRFGEHFALLTPLSINDSIKPGECLTFSLRMIPRDTGVIHDTLYIGYCGLEYAIALQSRGVNRNISLLADKTEFGEICTGDSVKKNVVVLRNNDPIPLLVNRIESKSSDFVVLSKIKDTTILPGGTLSADIAFAPQNVGRINGDIVIIHSDQERVIPSFTVFGNGVGADISTVTKVYFTPEVLTRKVKIKNNSNNVVTITDYELRAAGIANVTPQTPTIIPALSEIELTITLTRVLDFTEKDTLIITATPCATKRVIELLPYTATSVVTLPNIKADPKGDAIIPVTFTTVEPEEFGAVRKFTAEFTMNPRLFLPREVSSQFGKGTLIRNEIMNDKRIIGFSVEGTFPSSGTVAEIIGTAGMAEVLSTPLEFNNSSEFWGKAVTITGATNGTFSVTEGICGDPRITSPGIGLNTVSITPNPADDEAVLHFSSDSEQTVVVKCYDNLGNALFATSVNVDKGSFSIPLSTKELRVGAYQLSITSEKSSQSLPLLITR